MRRIFFFFVIFIAVVAGAYMQRVAILDWYEGVKKPSIPEAVSYQDVSHSNADREEIEMTLPPVQEDVPLQEETVQTEGEDAYQEDPPVIELPNEEVDEPQQDHEEESDPLAQEVLADEEDEPVEEEPLPSSINLAIPFTSQAPHGNWSEPYKESCEEASVYMVHGYYEGWSSTRIDPDQADLDLLKIVAFEEELFGYYEDTNAEKTGVFAELMFGYTYRMIENPTVEDIKKELVAGRPVIVPAAGRLLSNPYFTPPGPIYHMLVIRGYTEDGYFIANDPGTYRGESHLYDFDTIMYALHDWNDGNEITQGRKVFLILEP